jgi:hypothetical protein
MRPVIGGATALNMQYVPFGYSVVSGPSTSNSSVFDGSSEYSFNGSIIIVGVLVLIVAVIVVVGLVLYFKKIQINV